MSIKLNIVKNIFIGNGLVKEIGDIVKKIGAQNVLVITTKGRVKDGFTNHIVYSLSKKKIKSRIYDGVVSEPTIESILSCIKFVKKDNYDLLIGLGGGSTIDTTKISSIMATNKNKIYDLVGIDKINNAGLMTLMIPTTAGSGSEATDIAVFRDEKENVKKVIKSNYLLPTVTILDPLLTLTLPPKITAYTGMDALVHSIESFVSKNSNIITDCLSLEAFKIIINNLPLAISKGNDINARYNMCIGALIAGISETNAGVGAIHALAYPLEGLYKIPHGIANTVMLPYVLDFNYVQNNASKFRVLSSILNNYNKTNNSTNIVTFICNLINTFQLPNNLKDLEIKKTDLSKFANIAIQNTRLLSNNPRKIDLTDILNIYKRAWKGDLHR